MNAKLRANQKAANTFDMKLYALLAQAMQRRDERGVEWARWGTLALLLSGARPSVRAMMSEEDRKETS